MNRVLVSAFGVKLDSASEISGTDWSAAKLPKFSQKCLLLGPIRHLLFFSIVVCPVMPCLDSRWEGKFDVNFESSVNLILNSGLALFEMFSVS